MLCHGEASADFAGSSRGLDAAKAEAHPAYISIDASERMCIGTAATSLRTGVKAARLACEEDERGAGGEDESTSPGMFFSRLELTLFGEKGKFWTIPSRARRCRARVGRADWRPPSGHASRARAKACGPADTVLSCVEQAFLDALVAGPILREYAGVSVSQFARLRARPVAECVAWHVCVWLDAGEHSVCGPLTPAHSRSIGPATNASKEVVPKALMSKLQPRVQRLSDAKSKTAGMLQYSLAVYLRLADSSRLLRSAPLRHPRLRPAFVAAGGARVTTPTPVRVRRYG